MSYHGLISDFSYTPFTVFENVPLHGVITVSPQEWLSKEGSGLLGSPRWFSIFHSVFINGTGRMINAEKFLQHSRDPLATEVRVISGNALDESNMFFGYGWSSHLVICFR